jgi:hypothetical protein
VLAPPGAALAQTTQPEAVAGFESAGELLRKCRENSSFAKNFCFAYLAAVADSARAYRVWIGSGDPCLPSGLTMGKLADTFEAFLIANPSQTRAQAASVIVASLQDAFPCPVLAPAPAPPLVTAPAPAPAPVGAAPPAPSIEQADREVDPAPQQGRQPQQ